MIKLRILFSVVIFSVSSVVVALEASDIRYAEIAAHFPKMNDTYGLDKEDFDAYFNLLDKNIEQNPNDPIYHYIKGVLLLSEKSFHYRELSRIGNITKEDYLSTNEAMEMTIEYQQAFSQSMKVSDLSLENMKLPKFACVDILNLVKNLGLKESARENVILRTSLNDLRGCPEKGYEGDCLPIASSWEEYLFNEYIEMFNGYSELLDKENMERLESDFQSRIDANEKNSDVTDSLKSDQRYYLNKFLKHKVEFWERYEAGELDGKVVDINLVPQAYKNVPLYWKNYLYDKGIAEYAQWDTRGIAPPSQAGNKVDPLSQKEEAIKLVDKKKEPSLPTKQVNLVIENESFLMQFKGYRLFIFLVVVALMGYGIKRKS